MSDDVRTSGNEPATDQCSHCGEDFGYEIGWDDPPEGEGHIEVTWNPDDQPSYVVGETRRYCSPACLQEEIDELPFKAGGSA